MEELIVIKETVVKGYYEEPIYDHAPWLMYTNDVTHRLNPGDICYFDEEGRLFHESNEYGASLHDGTLWLCPTAGKMESIFGQLTEDTAVPWSQLMIKREEIEEKLDEVRSEFFTLEEVLDYYLDLENENASLDRAWESLAKKNQIEFKFKRLEYFYSGISLSIRLLVNTLKHWNYGKKASV